MTSQVPIVKNNANGAIIYLSLAPRTANGQWQANPTLAAGDVKISLDGGALANLNTLPVVTPASSKLVKVTLSQAETNADNIAILFSDAAGAEWCDLTVNLQTAAKQFDDLATQTSVDTVAGYVDTEVAAIKAKTDQLTFTISSQVDVNVVDWKGAAAPAMTGDAYARIGAAGAGLTALGDTRIAHLDADVSTCLAAAAYTAPDNAGIASIEAKTNNLPSDPADQSLIIAATDSLSGLISGLNDLSQADVRNAVGLASANLDTQLASLATAAGLSDLSDGISASFTALQGHGDGAWATATGFATVNPDNAGIAAIQERTGNLPDDPADQSLLAAATDAIMGRLGAPSGASLSGDVAAVKADTAAARGKTDQMAFTVSGQVDANMQSINDKALTGDGSTGNKFGPA